MMLRTLLITSTLFISSLCFGQNWSYPGCQDLEVLDLQFEGSSLVDVLVRNNCVDCQQHVYTGLLIIGQTGDTLAAHKYLFSYPNPPNEDQVNYRLEVFQPFMPTDIERIEMVGEICSQIPFNNLLTLGQDNVRLAPNPASGFTRIITSSILSFNAIAIIDGTGRSVRDFPPNTTTVNTNGLLAGTYFLLLTTDHSTITKPLIISR